MTDRENGTTKNDDPPTSLTLEEAMLRTGFGIYNIAGMLLCGMILMGMVMETLSLSYVMPAAQCDLELTLQLKGWLGAVPFIAIIVSSHLWGWLADTRGRRKTMLFSMATSVILSTLSSLSPNLVTFIVMRFLASIFTSGPCGVTYAYLGELNNSRHRDKMVAFGASFVGIATVVLPGVAWLILPLQFALPIPFLGIEYRSWRLLVAACALPYAISYFCMLWADESPKFLNAAGKEDACIGVLQRMFSANERKHKDKYLVKSIIHEPSAITYDSKSTGLAAVLRSMKEQTVPLFKPPLLGWTCLSCFVQFGILAATNGFYMWFPTILNSLANDDTVDGQTTRICDVLSKKPNAANETQIECDDTVNVLIYERAILVGLVFSSTYLIVGVLVDFIGKKMIIVVTLAITGACGVAAHLVPSQQTAVIMFAIFQMSGACIGLMTAVVVELYPTKLRAMAVCLSLMTGRVGSVLGSNVIGLLLETNCGSSFYLFGGLLIACSLCCLTLPGYKKTKSTKEVAPPGAFNQNENTKL